MYVAAAYTWTLVRFERFFLVLFVMSESTTFMSALGVLAPLIKCTLPKKKPGLQNTACKNFAAVRPL